MKKIILLLFVTLICTFVCSCKETPNQEFNEDYAYYLNDENVPEKWTWFDKEEYQQTLDDHVFEKITYEELKKKMDNNEKLIVYFGFKPELYQCPYCVVSLPIANQAAKEVNVDKIYYLDIYAMRTANTPEYQEIYGLIIDQLPDFGTRISVPDYFVFQGNDVLGHHCATVTHEDDSTKYYLDLNDEQKEELKQIYCDLFTK